VHEDVAEQLAALRRALDGWALRARDEDEAGFERFVREELAGIPEENAYLEAMPPETLYAGLARYWDRRNNGGA
jgi:hypothetical protein